MNFKHVFLILACFSVISKAYADKPISVYSYDYDKSPKYRPLPFKAYVEQRGEVREFEILAYGYSVEHTGVKIRVLRDTRTGLVWSTFVVAERKLESPFGKNVSFFTYDQNHLMAETDLASLTDPSRVPSYLPHAVTVDANNQITQQTLCTSEYGAKAFMGVLDQNQITHARLPYYDEIADANDFFNTKLFDFYSWQQKLWTSGGDNPAKIRYPYFDTHPTPSRKKAEDVLCVFETDPTVPLEQLGLKVVNAVTN